MIFGCKTIAEYAIEKWLWNNGIVATEFTVEINGNVGTITDKTGDSMTVEYDRETKEVKMKE